MDAGTVKILLAAVATLAAVAGVTVEYQLNFLTPKDFNKFFIKLRKNEAKGFRSELDIVLGQTKNE